MWYIRQIIPHTEPKTLLFQSFGLSVSALVPSKNESPSWYHQVSFLLAFSFPSGEFEVSRLIAALLLLLFLVLDLPRFPGIGG